MDRDTNPIQLAYAESKVSARLQARLVALLLLWAAAVVTIWVWL